MEIKKEFVTKLKAQKSTFKRTRANKFTREQGEQFIQLICTYLNTPKQPRRRNIPVLESEDDKGKTLDTPPATLHELTIEETLGIVAVHFQQGGTAKSCNHNTSVQLFDRTVKLSEIRAVLKTNQENGGERKLARTFATDIFTICSALEIPGNLHNKIRRIHPDTTFTETETYWLSDFQADNEDCPANLRKLINSSFPVKTTKGKLLPKTGK